MNPWDAKPETKNEETPREKVLRRLSEGVPFDLVQRAHGSPLDRKDPGIDMALAEGEILIYERARDSGVTGVVRAALRHEAATWAPKAEVTVGLTLEDLLSS